MEVKCDLCYLIVKRKTDLARHKKSDNCKKVNNILKTIIIENNNYKNEIEILKKELEKTTRELIEKDKQIKLLEEKSEEYRKIVEKAATKTTIKNNNNYQHNNYLNYISSEPIKFSNLKNQLKDIVTTQSMMYNDTDFHDHIVDNILKDKSGKDKLLCTDINRKNFTYKDETSGKMIYDPELERLREQLKKGTDVKIIRRDLLEKLVNEYEENGSIGIDPYKRFSEIIQKLNFGTPFVDHVAKKTYVKSCPTVSSKTGDKTKSIEKNNDDNKIVEINDNNENNNFKIEDESFDEEEYRKLYEEFGDEFSEFNKDNSK